MIVKHNDVNCKLPILGVYLAKHYSNWAYVKMKKIRAHYHFMIMSVVTNYVLW